MLACAPGPLRLAALGGSSTAGHALQRWSPALFHALLARRINDTFPHPAHQHTNAGTPGTGPVYMEKCLRYELPAGDRGGLDLDLVLVEYTQNNQYFADKVSLERLVRRLLALPSSPAVVLVSFPVWGALLCGGGGAEEAAGSPCRGDGIEELLVAPLAARYALPHVSLTSLLRAEAHRTGMRTPAASAHVDGARSRLRAVNVSAGWWQCHQKDRQSGGECHGDREGPASHGAPHPNHYGHGLVAAAIGELTLTLTLPLTRTRTRTRTLTKARLAGGLERGWQAMGRQNAGAADACFVKLRGLPYSADQHQIGGFFQPLLILGMQVALNNSAQPSGFGFVQFRSAEDVTIALSRSGQVS